MKTAEKLTDASSITLFLPNRKGNKRNSEGSFVTLADGRIMFAWSRYRGSSWKDEARADIAARFSSDGGITWSRRDKIIIRNEGDQNVMSTSLLRLHDGRIALFYLRKNSITDCRPYMRISADEAKSWSSTTLCATFPGYFCLLNNQAVQLESGRIILPVSKHDFTDSSSSVVYFISDDVGKTWFSLNNGWTPQSEAESLVAEPGIVELKDGRLYCYARTGSGYQWESTSSDQGQTWSEPRQSQFQSSQAPMNIKRIPKTGDLLALWNDLTPRWGVPAKELVRGWAKDSSWGRTPLVVAISSDEGKSWHNAKAIEDAPDRGFCYTAIHFIDDSVLLAYCCGGPMSGVLQDLCIRRISLQWLYT